MSVRQIPIWFRRLWPAEINKPVSYQDQIEWLAKKVKELEDRVTILEGEVNSENEQNG